jgi:hypothetical protein
MEASTAARSGIALRWSAEFEIAAVARRDAIPDSQCRLSGMPIKIVAIEDGPE